MHRLPLYATPPRAPVEVTPPLRRNPACTRCDLHRDAGIVCAGADGTMYQGPGTILVVTGAPMRRDVLGLGPLKAPPSNAAGPSGASAGTPATEAAPPHLPPLYAPSVAPVRHAIAAALARGATPGGTPPNVVYDWSIRCPLPRGSAPTKALLKPARLCRPYLSESIRATRPSRILALGAAAVLSIFGADAPHPVNVRRAWGWLASPPGDNDPEGTRHGRRATPVYFFDDPLAALPQERPGARRAEEVHARPAIVVLRPVRGSGAEGSGQRALRTRVAATAQLLHAGYEACGKAAGRQQSAQEIRHSGDPL
jgi:uracil-DNA glycosylase